MRNKFDSLIYSIKDNIDILMITEIKLDESFQIGQFFISGFSISLRLNRDRIGSGILLNNGGDIPSNLLSKENKFEAFS